MKKIDDSSEHRKFKREKSFVIGYLIDEILYITNISEKGCQIFSDNPDFFIEKGKIIELKVEMPDHEKQDIVLYTSVMGKVVWAKSVDECILLGIEFGDLNSNSQENLKKIVWYWNFLNSTFGNYCL